MTIAPYHLSLEDVLTAYKSGLFPMAEDKDSPDFYWYDPLLRGQLPIQQLHVSKNLRKTALRGKYNLTINTDFKGVIDGCAAATTDRPETWINRGIRDLFVALHQAGHAHSIEARNKDGKLVGGLYGLAIGGAFMGESMFSRATDASKVALVGLCAQLSHQGFTVLDTQYINEHLRQFGAYEIPRAEYLHRLQKAVTQNTIFAAPDEHEIPPIRLQEFLK